MILVQNMAPVKKKNARYKNNFKEIKSLTISDVLCPICRSIIIEPVSLPCHHLFCFKCFNGTIENNSLSCPICRLRIGSWLRSASKNNKIVNYELWEYIQESFKAEVEAKLNGKELTTSHSKSNLIVLLFKYSFMQFFSKRASSFKVSKPWRNSERISETIVSTARNIQKGT